MTGIGSGEPQLHPGAGAGAVELREDAPLKAAGVTGRGVAGAACCAGGPRLILACFAALTAAITLALFTQIYYGDYEVVPHGGVASDAAACSTAGTAMLKAGGRAVDAAAAAALCLAVLAPQATSLDASGSLLYWEYRRARTETPVLAEWGGPGVGTEAGGGGGGGGRAPRLLAALAELHAQHGALPWAKVLQPAIDLAKNGFPASEALSAALLTAGVTAPAGGGLRTAPALAAYLQSLQLNTSAELSSSWGATVKLSPAQKAVAGAWRLYVGGQGAGRVRRALTAALQPPPTDQDDAERRVLASLQSEAEAEGSWSGEGGAVTTGLAVVDSLDTYVAAVTGLSVVFGSGPATTDGWTHDEPSEPLDLAPAILLDDKVCGTRYVLGGGSSAALAQAAAALVTDGAGGAGGVERPRASLLANGTLSPETGLAAGALPAGARLMAGDSRTASVNVVQQRADALLTHADSRGGGLASRF